MKKDRDDEHTEKYMVNRIEQVPFMRQDVYKKKGNAAPAALPSPYFEVFVCNPL